MAQASDTSLDAALFGRAVRLLRGERGWSQELLAEKADLNRTYVGEVERGDVVPSILTAAKLADAFGVRLSIVMARCESLARPYEYTHF